MADVKKTEEKKVEKQEEKPAPKDNLVESKHSVKIGGKTIKYTVTTGTMILKEEIHDKTEMLKLTSLVPRSSLSLIQKTM